MSVGSYARGTLLLINLGDHHQWTSSFDYHHQNVVTRLQSSNWHHSYTYI